MFIGKLCLINVTVGKNSYVVEYVQFESFMILLAFFGKWYLVTSVFILTNNVF